MAGYLGRWQRRTGERRSAVLTSRGCPFDCSWCSKPTFGRTFRQQSPERVVRELQALHERYGVDYVRFCDDVFGISRAWLDELLDRMEAAELHLKFECLARVDLLKPDLLQRMRAAGLERVYVGVESGSQKMLDLMNRGTRLAQVERAAEALRAEGIRQFWFLMLGYPGESLADIEATLQLFRRFSPEEYSVSIAVPVPGTRFHEIVKDRLNGRSTTSRKVRRPHATVRSHLLGAPLPVGAGPLRPRGGARKGPREALRPGRGPDRTRRRPFPRTRRHSVAHGRRGLRGGRAGSRRAPARSTSPSALIGRLGFVRECDRVPAPCWTRAPAGVEPIIYKEEHA